MLKRASKPIAKLPLIQRAARGFAPAPVAATAPLTPAALPRLGFADLAVNPPAPRAGRIGLPDRLRRGMEALSGVALDDVAVHYNSPRPAEVDAEAFARGREIHLAPGQERHLPHEAWHLVQQAQGRVRPTMAGQTIEGLGGARLNDDKALEREAEVMGSRAAEAAPPARGAAGTAPAAARTQAAARPPLAFPSIAASAPIQRAKGTNKKKKKVYVSHGWFPKRRSPTSYSLTSGSRRQGPHFIPHVGKIVMSERSRLNNPKFNPARIRARSGLLPSPGQARKLMRIYQEKTGLIVKPSHLKKLDLRYRRLLEQRSKAKTQAQRERATARAIELNPMSTYGHGRKITPQEISGKGERRTTVAPDLDKMEKMKKGKKAPKFDRIDEGEGFKSKHLEKLLRDTGKVSKGEEDLSELELSSDDEY